MMTRSPNDTGLEVSWPGKWSDKGERTPFELSEDGELRTLERWGGGQNLFDEPGLLLKGDNLAAGEELLERYRGKVRLIYLDPPFNLGRAHTGRFHLAPNVSIDVECFDDAWGEGTASFAHFLWQRLMLAKELLAEDGSIFLHGNDHTAPLLRALLDDVFGADHFLNQIVWHYTGGGRAKTKFSNKHDLIFWYRKGRDHVFNIDAVREPYSPTSGYAKGGITATSGKHYTPHPDGTPVDDVWDIPMLNPLAHERTGYATQKPQQLLERIVVAASEPGDLIADLFCGAGTTGTAAQALKRRVLLCDASGLAVAITRARLLEAGTSFELAALVDAKTREQACRLQYQIADGELALLEYDAEHGLDDLLSVTVEGFDRGGQAVGNAVHLIREKPGTPLPGHTALREADHWRMTAYDFAGNRLSERLGRGEGELTLESVW